MPLTHRDLGRRVACYRIGWLSVVKDVRAGEVDICSGQVDFHINVIGRRSRIDIEDRFIVRVVDEPTDAFCVHSVGRADDPLNIGRARNGCKVDMI